MTESPHIVQLDASNFMQIVVEGSDTVPVLVDFWAMGALPEPELRKFLETHVGPPGEAPAPAEEAEPESPVSRAMALHEAGASAEARAVLQQAQAAEPDNAEVLLALGQICVAEGDLDTAESCLKALPEAERDGAQAKRLGAIVTLARESGSTEDLGALQAAHAANPDDGLPLGDYASGPVFQLLVSNAHAKNIGGRQLTNRSGQELACDLAGNARLFQLISNQLRLDHISRAVDDRHPASASSANPGGV